MTLSLMSRVLFPPKLNKPDVSLHSGAGRAPRQAPIRPNGWRRYRVLALVSAALDLAAGKHFPGARASPSLTYSSKVRPCGRCGFMLFPHRPYQPHTNEEGLNMTVSAAQHCASRAFTDDVLFYWMLGHDSADIAEILCCTEALVYNVLARLRNAGRGLL